MQYAAKQGIISLLDVQEKIKMQRLKDVLAKHQYEIWEGKNQKWYTYIKDDNQKNGRRLIKRTSESAIHIFLLEYYDEKTEQNRQREKISNLTLKDLFLEWIKFKELHTGASSYIKRILADWSKFYESDNEFITAKIKDITTVELDEWAHKKIKEYDLTKKQYYNMSVIIRQSLEYAKEKGYIDKSPFSDVNVNSKLFRKVKKKSNKTQVYLVDEKPKMIEEMYRRFYNNTKDTAPLAIILDFETGMRIGEIVALKRTDIEGNYIHVQRQEVRDFTYTDETHMKFSGYKVVEHPKTSEGDRMIYLTKNARELIDLILSYNSVNGEECEDYLFVKEGKRINHYALEARVLRGCETIGIDRKTIHKIRKTYISSLIDSGLNISEVMKLAGHADERTTYSNYCYNRFGDEATEAIIEEALSEVNTPDNSENSEKVIKGNQKIVSFFEIKNTGNPRKTRISSVN